MFVFFEDLYIPRSIQVQIPRRVQGLRSSELAHWFQTSPNFFGDFNLIKRVKHSRCTLKHINWNNGWHLVTRFFFEKKTAVHFSGLFGVFHLNLGTYFTNSRFGESVDLKYPNASNSSWKLTRSPPKKLTRPCKTDIINHNHPLIRLMKALFPTPEIPMISAALSALHLLHLDSEQGWTCFIQSLFWPVF